MMIPVALAANYHKPLTKPYADTLYCAQVNGCGNGTSSSNTSASNQTLQQVVDKDPNLTSDIISTADIIARFFNGTGAYLDKVEINMSDDDTALYINSRAGTETAVLIDSVATTGTGLELNMEALTNGIGLYVHTDSEDFDGDSLARFYITGGEAVSGNVLEIENDGPGQGFVVTADESTINGDLVVNGKVSASNVSSDNGFYANGTKLTKAYDVVIGVSGQDYSCESVDVCCTDGDCSDEIEECNGKHCYLKKGNYTLTNPITITANTTVTGAGMHSTFITTYQYLPFVFRVNGSYTTIERLTVDGGKKSANMMDIYANKNQFREDITIQQVKLTGVEPTVASWILVAWDREQKPTSNLKNLVFDNIVVEGYSTLNRRTDNVAFSFVDGLTVTNSEFRNLGRVVSVFYSQKVLMSGNRFTNINDTASVGFQSSDAIFSNNIINTTGKILVISGSRNVTNIKILDNLLLSGAGIDADTTNNAYIKGLEIRGNTILNSLAPIAIEDDISDVIISQNYIKNASSAGIYVNGLGPYIISNNIIKNVNTGGASWQAIVTLADNGLITGNMIIDEEGASTDTCIRVTTTNNTLITNNFCQGISKCFTIGGTSDRTIWQNNNCNGGSISTGGTRTYIDNLKYTSNVPICDDFLEGKTVVNTSSGKYDISRCISNAWIKLNPNTDCSAIGSCPNIAYLMHGNDKQMFLPNLTVFNDGIGHGIFINQNGNGIAMRIDSESTTSNIVTIDDHQQGSIFQIRPTNNTDYGNFYMYRNLNSSATNTQLVYFKQDNILDDQNVLDIQQDGTGYGIFIDQNGDQTGLYIDSEATTDDKYGLKVDTVAGGADVALFTSGSSNYFRIRGHDETTARNWFYSNYNSGTTNSPVLVVQQDHKDDDQDALKIVQDGTGNGILIDMNNNATTSTTTGALAIENSKNVNQGLSIYTDMNSDSLNPLVSFNCDNNNFDQSCLTSKQDGTGDGITIDQNGNGFGLNVFSESSNRSGINIAMASTQYTAIDTNAWINSTQGFSTSGSTISDILTLNPGTAPGSPSQGDIYSSSVDNHLYYYNSTDWVEIA